MGYLIGQIVFCLLVAAILGFIIGWLLRSLVCRNKISELTQTWNNNTEKLEQELSLARQEVKQKDTELANAQAKIRQFNLDLETERGKPAPVLSPVDDLKQISGIGKFIEGRLNKIGITTFRQIANFTEGDIARVAENIKFFPGRIERDNWIEQAKQFHQQKYGEKL